LNSATPRDATRFFHTCSSQLKGTKRLIELWQRHPEWPELVTVINHNETIPAEIFAPNIRAIREPLPEERIREMQNSYTFHLCTSEAEGFGHYIMEAMSCRAVVLATDAPPMNEVVQPDRGLLIDCLPERLPVNLSHRYFFDPAALERQIERARAMTPPEIAQLGAAARDYSLQSNAAFARNFPELLHSLLR
jgi:glycosyltransferase involved in cell wall biosynthesis